ncbi:MAG: hypothetical protein ABJB65_06970 [Chloroflexota bacterium]
MVKVSLLVWLAKGGATGERLSAPQAMPDRGGQYTNRPLGSPDRVGRYNRPAAWSLGMHAARQTFRGSTMKRLIRTFAGPSRDPRMMAYISRPLPRDLTDEQVVAALDIALGDNPDPAYMVETLPAALRQVTGHTYQVMDRSTRDVTGAFGKTQVMIRDGDVGSWPGYAAMSYPLLAPSAKAEETRAAIAATDGNTEAPPARKPGWEPPPPVERPR